jgi:hypothetical protein
VCGGEADWGDVVVRSGFGGEAGEVAGTGTGTKLEVAVRVGSPG